MSAELPDTQRDQLRAFRLLVSELSPGSTAAVLAAYELHVREQEATLARIEALRPAQAGLANGHVRDVIWWGELRAALTEPQEQDR